MNQGQRVGREVRTWLETYGAAVALALGLIVAAWFAMAK
jgi:hypothetical protein